MIKNVNLITPISANLGYGVTGVNILKALIRMGASPTLFALGPVSPEKRDLGVVESRRFDHLKINSYDTNAPMIRNYHEYEMWFPPGKGLKIAWPFFETDRLYRKSVSLLNGCDAVAAGSEWIEEILRENKVTAPIFRANQGVDTNIFKPMDVPESDTYKFFTLGKFEVRKGHYELIQAFKEAFPNEDDVRLYMMCHNPFVESPMPGFVIKEIQNTSNNDRRVVFVPPVPTQAEVAAFINRCDCGVFPSRGEGWGLPMLETLACGKPLLATFVTSHKEYLNHEVAGEIAVEGLRLANDGMFFKGDRGSWYQPSVNSISQLMRKAYDTRARHNTAGRSQAEKFSWDRAANMLIDGIADLC